MPKTTCIPASYRNGPAHFCKCINHPDVLFPSLGTGYTKRVIGDNTWWVTNVVDKDSQVDEPLRHLVWFKEAEIEQEEWNFDKKCRGNLEVYCYEWVLFLGDKNLLQYKSLKVSQAINLNLVQDYTLTWGNREFYWNTVIRTCKDAFVMFVALTSQV